MMISNIRLKKVNRCLGVILLGSMFLGIAHAEPLTIAGLNWGVSSSEIIDEIESRGYSCAVSGFDHLRECAKTEDSAHQEKIRLDLKEEEITLACEVFNGCDYSVEEVAQQLVDNRIIDQLAPDTGPYGGLIYRGRGADGDRLVVSQNGAGSDVWAEISILKGTLGQGDMDF